MIDLICMRLADMKRVHPDQITGACAKCGETVGIYPSGQRVMKERDDIRVICHVCRKPADIEVLAPGAELERLQSRDKE